MYEMFPFMVANACWDRLQIPVALCGHDGLRKKLDRWIDLFYSDNSLIVSSHVEKLECRGQSLSFVFSISPKSKEDILTLKTCGCVS